MAEVATWLGGDPTSLLERLEARMRDLGDDQRFEDAARARRRLALVAAVLSRSRRAQALVALRELVLVRRVDDGVEAIRITDGRLAAAARLDPAWSPDRIQFELRRRSATLPPAGRGHREEVDLLLAHVDREDVELLSVEGDWALPIAGGRELGRVQAVATGLAGRLRRDRHLLRGNKVATTRSAA